HADVLDGRVKLAVAPGQETELIVEVAMHGRFDRRGAAPDALTSHQGGDEAQNRAAGAPEPDQAAWPGVACRHRGGEDRAVPNLVLQHVVEIGYDVGKQQTRDGDLRPIDADGAVFASMVHAYDAGDR